MAKRQSEKSVNTGGQRWTVNLQKYWRARMEKSDEGRRVRIATQFSLTGLEILDRRRALVGMSRSAYLRHAVFEQLPPMIPMFNREVWRSLGPAIQALAALEDRVGESSPTDAEKISAELHEIAKCIRLCRRQALGLATDGIEVPS